MAHDLVAMSSDLLDPAALSARAARRLVRRVLTDGNRLEWVETAELAVSELVTNAVLHAHTPVHVRVELTTSQLRVQVRDDNPVMPAAPQWQDDATTGRGLALVAALTTAFGVEPADPTGKTVWFTISDPGAGVQLESSGHPQVSEILSPEHGRRVELCGFPAALWLAAREHHDALLRELMLHRAAHPDSGVTGEDLARADAARLTVAACLDQALADHGAAPATLDLAVFVPAAAAEQALTLQDVLDEAERLARDGRLLARPALPEIVAARDWVCEQIVAQLAGAPPVPWPGATTGDTDHSRTHPAIAWDGTPISASEGLLIAADDANRILAVSPPLAAALGYGPDELVGRRLVTIIPPQLREAHVAGFTRHLATGRRRMLGGTVDVPALHADGRQLPARLCIDEQRLPGGRSVFVATLDVLTARSVPRGRRSH